MLIYFHKYNPFVNLTPFIPNAPMSSYTGGNEERMSILKMFHTLGHDVVINTICYGKDIKWIKSDDCKGTDYEFLRDFKYQLYKLVPKGAMFFVEFGTTNLRYCFGDKKYSCIYEFNKLVKNYRGNIYYWQGDIALPVVFHPELLSYKFFKGLPWAKDIKKIKQTYNDLTESKHWICMQRSHKELWPIFLKKNDMPRGQYSKMVKDGDMSLEYIPTGVDFDLIYKGFHKPKKKMKYPLIYIGNQRPRVRRFREYFKDTGVNIFGKWNEQTIASFGDVKYHGKIPNSEANKYYRKGGCTLYLCDEAGERLGWFPPRFTETIANGCITFVHKEYTNWQELNFPEICVVENPEEFKIKVKNINKMTRKGRMHIVRAQQKAIKQWSIYRWGHTLRRIYEKYEKLKLWRK